MKIILDYIRADNPEAANRFGTALLNHLELGIRRLLHTPIRVYYKQLESGHLKSCEVKCKKGPKGPGDGHALTGTILGLRSERIRQGEQAWKDKAAQ